MQSWLQSWVRDGQLTFCGGVFPANTGVLLPLIVDIWILLHPAALFLHPYSGICSNLPDLSKYLQFWHHTDTVLAFCGGALTINTELLAFCGGAYWYRQAAIKQVQHTDSLLTFCSGVPLTTQTTLLLTAFVRQTVQLWLLTWLGDNTQTFCGGVLAENTDRLTLQVVAIWIFLQQAAQFLTFCGGVPLFYTVFIFYIAAAFCTCGFLPDPTHRHILCCRLSFRSFFQVCAFSGNIDPVHCCQKKCSCTP